ncbi:aminoglycoside adenylyltransferase family protein [Streptomyces sp. NRRL B-24085]|uniref:aminoglycoside adenylyltransferase family protein n=1 Tax=Streptomyces sp. NRRL B-24085 TaxID=1709476 RepID=UPI0006B37D7D|nr:aminoglycoside adenylyltransferase family protein [Streptomyces sp. NRRL B-24085]
MSEDHGAAELLPLLHRTLGDNVLGICLHGSAVLAGLRPHSDIDVLVVARRSLSRDERRSLVGELMRVSGVPGARPVELIVVVQDEVRPWRYPPVCDFLYGEWLREEYERGVLPERESSPDLATLLTMTLAGNTALHGPAPAELLDRVPLVDLRRAIVAGVPQLLDNLEHDTRNVLLTLARIWTTLATDSIRSKDAAADWAAARLPEGHRAVLAHAQAIYLGEAEERWSGELRAGVRPCADFLVGAIGRQSVS